MSTSTFEKGKIQKSNGEGEKDPSIETMDDVADDGDWLALALTGP